MKKYKIVLVVILLVPVIFFTWNRWFSMNRAYNKAFAYHLSINSQKNLSQVDLLKEVKSKALIALSPYFDKLPEIMISVKNKHNLKFTCVQEVEMEFNINENDLKSLVWKRRAYDIVFDLILTSLNEIQMKRTFTAVAIPLVKISSDKNGCAIVTFINNSASFKIPEQMNYNGAFKYPILQQYDLFISEKLSDKEVEFHNTDKTINAGKELWQYLQYNKKNIRGRYLEIPVQDIAGLNYKIIVQVTKIVSPGKLILSNTPYIKKFDINEIGCYPLR